MYYNYYKGAWGDGLILRSGPRTLKDVPTRRQFFTDREAKGSWKCRESASASLRRKVGLRWKTGGKKAALKYGYAAGGDRARDLQISQVMALRRNDGNPMSLAP